MTQVQHRERFHEVRIGHDRLAPHSREEIWSDLHHLGQARMTQLAATIDHLAPKPGVLVYLHSTVLPCRLSDLEAVVFSAFDASTHLQIARIYLTNTLASALDFAEFFLHKFPFPVSQVRTLTMNPFYLSEHPATEQRFSNHLAVRGVLHSCTVSTTRDPIFSLASTLSFSPLSILSAGNASSDELTNEFSNFLFYHNNRRPLTSLQGKTPIQKLRTFSGFSHLDSFDPFAR